MSAQKRHVYEVEWVGDETGTESGGLYGTRARARRLVREHGYTWLHDTTAGGMENWHHPGTGDYPGHYAIVRPRVVR